MTVACATDGNNGRSVARGRNSGAKAAIFVHSGVSEERVAAIAALRRTDDPGCGHYWRLGRRGHSCRSREGLGYCLRHLLAGVRAHSRLVMQGYTAMVREALRQLPEPPTHVFVQAGVGGVAAAVAGHLAIVLGDRRPTFVVVEPERAACLYETARAGHPVKIDHGEPTVMAMLECYEPSLVAWRVLSRVADAFMTVDDEDAVAA